MNEETNDDLSLERIKEHLIEDLGDQYARGILDSDEYEELVRKTVKIANKYDLARLADDLPDVKGSDDTADSPRARGGEGQAPFGDPPGEQWNRTDSIVSVLGENNRSGKWKPAKQIKVFALMSDLNIDFTQAEFSEPVVYIDFFSIMSDIDIIVPPHVQVEFSGTPLLSSHNDKTIKINEQNGPVLRINGVSFMADMVVKESDD